MLRNKTLGLLNFLLMGTNLFLTPLFLQGCSNSFLSKLAATTAGTVATLPSPSVNSTANPSDVFIISSITINVTSTSAGSSTATGTTDIFFDTTKSTAPVINHCNIAAQSQTSKPCLCQYTWAEINPNSGSNLATTRNVQTSVTQVQANLLVCDPPSVYAAEIIAGTQIKITVIPAPGNPDAAFFTTTPKTYTKSPTALVGAFQDAQGHVFDNIVHYSCYNKYGRGLTIQSKSLPVTNSTTNATANALYATSFCLTPAGQTTPNSACPLVGSASNSAETYYFSLYIRNSEKGDINKFNDAFNCPVVQEPLNGATSVGSTGQFWPMDTTFALSLGATTDFSVGVQANTKLSSGTNDPTAAVSQCYPAANGGSPAASDTKSLITSCLGFAARVAADGTCPNIRSAAGQVLQTYRLRRFIALHPPLFDTNGDPTAIPQSIDTIYVLDRPIATAATVNPLKPYTMLGPKPCPSAFFDKNNVAAAAGVYNLPFGYRATNDSRWKTGDGLRNYTKQWTKGTTTYDNGGTNIDGIEFPNFDGASAATGYSCSAAIPFLSSDGSRYLMATVNKYRTEGKFQHLYVRPYTPYIPHYEEDTSFLACAPQANPFQDAPLHLMPSTNGGTQAWCSESYPTQNPNITTLDPAVKGAAGTPNLLVYPAADPSNAAHMGLVAPYTSHLSKINGVLATQCTATSIFSSPPPAATYVYPAGGATWGYAQHSSATTWETIGNASETCDRTVVTSADIGWSLYPLLAPATDVENAISTDSSYNCSVTYDNAAGKAAAVPPQTPAGGCCSLKSSPGTLITAGTHIEPLQTSCLPPLY